MGLNSGTADLIKWREELNLFPGRGFRSKRECGVKKICTHSDSTEALSAVLIYIAVKKFHLYATDRSSVK